MILLNILILPLLTIIIATTTENTLEHVIAEVGKDKLSPGKYLEKFKGEDPKKYLATVGDVGIVLDIENYSGLQLEDPVIYVHAGYKDEKYGHPHNMGGTQQEVFLYHNKKRLHRRSAGSISWMITKDGKPIWENESKVSRVHFMWDLPKYSCKSETVNTVSVGFHTHDKAKITEELQYRYYDLHLNRARVFAHHNHFLARVNISRGCLPSVLLQFASSKKDHKSDQVASSVVDKFNPLDEDFSLLSILLLSAGVMMGVVVLIGGLLQVRRRRCKGRDSIYRSSVRGDRNSEVEYHHAEQTDEETEDEIFTANKNSFD
eukprot:GFUD01089214.1.p1 GENE.GFUD01089214.1~~GFUD01089214.1.p1  ORF type:complete len:318 (+),score=86.97 GFUD01089214.1:131-1084(+)